jgi:hypothetical protein
MKRFFRRFVGTALAVSAIAGCTDPVGSGAVWTKPGSLAAVAPTRYTVSVAADPAASGTITGPDRTVEGTIGQQFTWTAVPASGYYFKEWKLLSAKTTKTDNPYTHTIASGETIVAVFGKLSSTITLPTGDGSRIYRYDASIQIRVAPTSWTNTGSWKFQFYGTNQNEPIVQDSDGDSSISMGLALVPSPTTLTKVSDLPATNSLRALSWSKDNTSIAAISTARVYRSDGTTLETAYRLLLMDAPSRAVPSELEPYRPSALFPPRPDGC